MAASKANCTIRNAPGTRRVGFTVNGQYLPVQRRERNRRNLPDPYAVLDAQGDARSYRHQISCDQGACGCCTVIMDGKAVLSCKILTIECDGKTITTIEGLRDRKTGALDPLQQSFIDHTAFQCGFCTPGMIMTAKALLNENPHPTEEEIKEAFPAISAGASATTR